MKTNTDKTLYSTICQFLDIAYHAEAMGDEFTWKKWCNWFEQRAVSGIDDILSALDEEQQFDKIEVRTTFLSGIHAIYAGLWMRNSVHLKVALGCIPKDVETEEFGTGWSEYRDVLSGGDSPRALLLYLTKMYQAQLGDLEKDMATFSRWLLSGVDMDPEAARETRQQYETAGMPSSIEEISKGDVLYYVVKSSFTAHADARTIDARLFLPSIHRTLTIQEVLEATDA